MGVGISAHAFSPMEIPPLADFVVDYAWVLSSGDLQSLNQQWQNIQLQTSAQIAAILIPTQEDYQLVDIWLKVFRETALGQKNKNNGVLLVINTEQNKIRIVVGYGLEWAIPDILARDIIETDIRSLVESWNYTQAIQNYYTRVQSAIESDGTSSAITKSNQWDEFTLPDIIAWAFWALLFFVLIFYIKDKNSFYNWLYIPLHKRGYVKSKNQLYVLLLVISILIIIAFLITATVWATWSVIGALLGNWFWFTASSPRSGRWWYRGWWLWGGGFGWGFSGGWGGFSFWWWWGSSGWGWAGD